MKITSIVSKVFGSHTARPQTSTAINPFREWIIGILVALITLCGGAAYASFFFWYRIHAVDAETTSEVGMIVYNKAAVDAVLKAYRERTLHFEALRGEVGTETSVSNRTETLPDPFISEESLGAE